MRLLLHDMGVTRPSLLPLFRSHTQLGVLSVLFAAEAGALPITDIAQRVGLPLSSVSREVARLGEAGIVLIEVRGRVRLVEANRELPYARALTEMIEVTGGVEACLREAFAGLSGVESVVAFGSWAARRRGLPGRPPNDIDLIVVGEPDAFDVMAAVQEVESVARLPVNAITVALTQWNDPEDPFIRQIKDGPTVEIDVGVCDPDSGGRLVATTKRG